MDEKEKIQFIIEKYPTLTEPVIAHILEEDLQWIKKQVRILVAQNKLKPKLKFNKTQNRKAPEKIQFVIDNYDKLSRKELAGHLNESTRWVKTRACELRQKYLKTNKFICEALKKEFNFEINPPAFQFWMTHFGYKGRTKQKWLDEFLPKDMAIDFLQKNYTMVKVSEILKEKYKVYVSNDLILCHYQKLGLPSLRLYRQNKLL